MVIRPLAKVVYNSPRERVHLPGRHLNHSVVLSLICCLVLAIATIALLPAQELPPDQPNYYAVIIGVSEFEYLPREEWLDYADDDAQAFYQFITSPRGRAFPPENVFLMTNEEASQIAIRRRLGSTLAKKIKPDDTVYIFIATHGIV